jgi:hypothetical protein
MNAQYQKPRKTIVAREQAATWTPDKYLIQEKIDGVFSVLELALDDGSAKVAGEFVTPKSGGFLAPQLQKMLRFNSRGVFVAFDLLEVDGHDFACEPAMTRWAQLLAFTPFFPEHWMLVPATIQNAKEFIEMTLRSGAEGIVAKPVNAPYGEMECCKVLETRECVVVTMGGSQSVGIAENVNGTLVDRGRVKLSGRRCDMVRVGSIIRVDGLGLTDDLKIREPRRHNDDGWLLRL